MCLKMLVVRMGLRGECLNQHSLLHGLPSDGCLCEVSWGPRESLLNMGVIVPSFFQPPILRKCTSFLPLPFNLSQPPSLRLTSLSPWAHPSPFSPLSKPPSWVFIDNFPARQTFMLECLGLSSQKRKWLFLLHLLHA